MDCYTGLGERQRLDPTLAQNNAYFVVDFNSPSIMGPKHEDYMNGGSLILLPQNKKGLKKNCITPTRRLDKSSFASRDCEIVLKTSKKLSYPHAGNMQNFLLEYIFTLILNWKMLKTAH